MLAAALGHRSPHAHVTQRWNAARRDIGDSVFDAAVAVVRRGRNIQDPRIIAQLRREDYVDGPMQDYVLDALIYDHQAGMPNTALAALNAAAYNMDEPARLARQEAAQRAPDMQRRERQPPAMDDDTQELTEDELNMLVDGLSQRARAVLHARLTGEPPAIRQQPADPRRTSVNAEPPHTPIAIATPTAQVAQVTPAATTAAAPNTAEQLLDAQRGTTTVRLADGLRMAAYISADDEVWAPSTAIHATAREWQEAFQSYRVRQGTNCRTPTSATYLNRQAQIYASLLAAAMPPTTADRTAWEPRFMALFQVAEAYVAAHLGPDAGANLYTRLIAQWSEGRVFIHTAVTTAINTTAVPAPTAPHAGLAPPTQVYAPPARQQQQRQPEPRPGISARDVQQMIRTQLTRGRGGRGRGR